MLESKAISPDVKSLLNTVKSQADQYSKAFDLLHNKISEFDNSISSLNQYKDFFIKEFTVLAQDTRSGINSLNRELEDKVNKVLKMYESLESMNHLKDTLFSLQEKLKERHKATDSAIDEFRTKAEIEFESTLMSLKYRMEKEIESLSQKFEVKIDFKLKRLEASLLNYDNKIVSIIDYQNREFKSIKDDLDSLRYKVNKSIATGDGKFTKTELKSTQIEQLQERFDERIESVNKSIKQLRDEDMKLIADSIPTDSMLLDINTIKTSIGESNVKFEKIMKKLSLVQGIAVASLIMAILAMSIGFIV